MTSSSHHEANALIHESSPYLQQHAYNPVDWHAWSDEVINKAKEENKLLIISIGYATCHWCHVMERESFEDQEVADLMNAHFISIKVDREERPDLDELYMTTCQLTSQRGCGWPLNAIALPDGRPVWAGTYYPKEGWMNVLQQFVDLNDEQPERLTNAADQIHRGLLSSTLIEAPAKATSYADIEVTDPVVRFALQIDRVHGGRRGAPKFPMPNSLTWLFMMGYLLDRHEQQDLVQLTARRMALSGIFDQLQGGFARYATDEAWKIPHFEKMLYDNGQLLDLYSELHRTMPNMLYASTIQQTVAWIKDEMTTPEGGFLSAVDADSEGVEGKYYIWTADELRQHINHDPRCAIFFDRYGITDEGNWEDGHNILHAVTSIKSLAQKYELPEVDIVDHLDEARQSVLHVRSNRIAPIKDDKVLTSWNAICSHGLLSAYQATGEQATLDLALANVDFIRQHMMHPDGRLLRSYQRGKGRISGFLEDYASCIRVCLSSYEMTLNEDYLQDARQMADYTIAHFYDTQRQLFYLTSDLDTTLSVRQIQTTDNVIPASNSMMAHALLKLSHYFDHTTYRDIVEHMAQRMLKTITEARYPSFYSNWWRLIALIRVGYYEVSIVGPDALDYVHEMRKKYLPFVLIAGTDSTSDLPMLQLKSAGATTEVYVCHQQACQAPMDSVKAVYEWIQSSVHEVGMRIS